jgi:hypothetical protein
LRRRSPNNTLKLLALRRALASRGNDLVCVQRNPAGDVLGANGELLVQSRLEQ